MLSILLGSQWGAVKIRVRKGTGGPSGGAREPMACCPTAGAAQVLFGGLQKAEVDLGNVCFKHKVSASGQRAFSALVPGMCCGAGGGNCNLMSSPKCKIAKNDICVRLATFTSKR